MRKQLPRITYKTKQQRNKELEEKKKSINYTTEAIIAVVCISLKDEFGFGNKRFKRLMDRIKSNFDCVDAGTVSVDDFILWYREETKENE